MSQMTSKYSKRAMSMENSSVPDRIREILFPILFEDLGYSYSNTSLAQKVLIGHDMDEALDYGIFENADAMIFRLGILIVNDGMTFSSRREALFNLMKMYPGIKKGLLTDGIKYEFYDSVVDGARVIDIGLAHEFNLVNMNEKDEEFLMIFKNPDIPNKQTEIRYTEKDGSPLRDNDAIDFDNEDEEEYDSRPTKKEKVPKPQKQPKKSKKFPIIPIIIILLIAVLGYFAYPKVMDFINNQKTTVDNPVKDNNKEANFLEWDNIDDGSNTTSHSSSIQHIELNSVIATSIVKNNDLQISLLNTNIPDGAIIKFGIFCGSNFKDYVYATIENGECTTVFDIPETWNNPELTIITYLRFDETGDYKQPSNVRDKYGDEGEYIIVQKGAPKYAFNFTYATHENEAVVAYINAQLQASQNTAIATREKDFAKIDTQYDAKGNIKHVPLGFDMNKANITETRHIYPMIFHDANTGKSYFYIVAGYIGKDWLSFESIALYCDSYAWGYEVGSNKKERQLGGNACSEWVYFTNESILTLLNDMNLLCNSNECKIRFTGGPIKSEYVITAEEKANIKLMLYIFSTYYGNGTKVPDVEWFKPQAQSVDLSYLKTPEKILERNSEEIQSMESLQSNIAYKRQNGKTVTASEQATYDQMQKTYKIIDTKAYSKLLNTIKNSDAAYPVYDLDKAHSGISYMKFYLSYDNEGTIESGYIPYIIVYSDKTIQFPYITEGGSITKDNTKTIIEITISADTYSEILSAVNNTDYQYLGG